MGVDELGPSNTIAKKVINTHAAFLLSPISVLCTCALAASLRACAWVCACDSAGGCAGVSVRVRAWLQTPLDTTMELAYSHDTKNTHTHRFPGNASRQGLDAKYRHQPTGHAADQSLYLGIGGGHRVKLRHRATSTTASRSLHLGEGGCVVCAPAETGLRLLRGWGLGLGFF
jgi:hypothetical protein